MPVTQVIDFELGEILYYPVLDKRGPAVQRVRFIRVSHRRKKPVTLTVDRGGYEEDVSIHLIFKTIGDAMARAAEMTKRTD